MSALSLIKKDLLLHQVEVVLPQRKDRKKLSLIVVTAKTSLIKDIEISYPDANETQLKFARKLFGEEETNNDYGVFVSVDNLAYVFAFNRAFARYDPKTKTVVYTDLDDFLTKNLPASGKPNSTGVNHQESSEERMSRSGQRGRSGYRFGGGRGALIKYATAESLPE